MYKKMIVFVLGMVILIWVIAPVMATSPKKIPVELKKTGFSFTKATIWTTGNMLHGADMVTGNSGCTIIGEGVNLIGGSTAGLADFHINQENGRGNLFYKITITFPGGFFVGHQELHGTFKLGVLGFPNLVKGDTYAVFQGNEDYQGWTLTFRRYADGTEETFMLIP